MKSLDQIGVECGTDKSTLTHNYLYNYELYLNRLRHCNIVVLEIGVGNGSSIKMWRKFFDDAKVYGIDINPDCAGEGIFIGDQSDFNFLQSVLDEIGSPDLIVDDGSHVGSLTILSFEYLFPKMKEQGIYVVEDCATFYSKTYSGEFESNGRSKVFNFFTGLAYDVDVAGRGMTGNVEYALQVENPNFDPVPKYSRILDSINIHPSLWLFRRK